MAIDLAALKRASEGDPSAKVMVNKAWLAEVHKMLTAPTAAKSRLRPEVEELASRIFGRARTL